MRECLPVSLILKNRLKYALSRREVATICMRRHVAIDGKIRTDTTYPAGFMDVVSLAASDEHFRLMYDTKGRFILHRIGAEESKFKLVKITKVQNSKKSTAGRNPFFAGQKGVVPTATGHDSRTFRFADPAWKASDSVKFNMETGKVEGHYKFEVGCLTMVTAGANIGRIGVVTNLELHPGSFNIVHLKDAKGTKFATRAANVFVLGDDEAVVSLPKSGGIKKTILDSMKSNKE